VKGTKKMVVLDEDVAKVGKALRRAAKQARKIAAGNGKMKDELISNIPH
jgi:hypothetical protein